VAEFRKPPPATVERPNLKKKKVENRDLKGKGGEGKSFQENFQLGKGQGNRPVRRERGQEKKGV